MTLPNDFETCATGSRNLLAEQMARIEALEQGLTEVMKQALQNSDDATYQIARNALTKANGR